MSRAPADVAVLFHARDRGRDLKRYAIGAAVRLWRDDGLQVEVSFGTRRFVPATVGFLHVDLSVVPPAYLQLARRYPVAVNTRMSDVRKSRISAHLVTLDDAYDGPVILKTDANFAGHGERALLPPYVKWWRRIGPHARRDNVARIRSKAQYRVVSHKDLVPSEVWQDPRLVVERFLPTRTPDGRYAVWSHLVLGGQVRCCRSVASNPIVFDDTLEEVAPAEPHPDVEALCEREGLDFGKVDYTVREGRAVILDVNKTIGQARASSTRLVRDGAPFWRAGIRDLLARG